MATTRVNLDTTQYVRVTSDPLQPSSLLLQSHRDTVRIAFSDVKPARDNTVFHELGEKDGPYNIPLTEVAVWALATSDRCALPPLTRGCLLRVKKPTGDFVNLFNWKTNGGFIIRSFDHSFQEKVGVVPNEELQIVIQDDLSSGLAEFLALAQGHELQET